MKWFLIALLVVAPPLPVPIRKKQPSGRADMLMVKVRQPKALPIRIMAVAWRYPTNSYGYRWSLELTTNFVNWITVTNYPYGYTNDVWVTNNYNLNTMFAYRMHGHL